MDQRVRFVLGAEHAFHSISELCRRCGISRPTRYKWIERYEAAGLEGLEDRSHRPGACPHATPPEIVARLKQLRRHRGWGARKLRKVISKEFATIPCVDAVHDTLRRSGLVNPELIEPDSPHQNGRHERMHRTLEAKTTRPPKKDLRGQHHRFDAFRLVFNEERPHEALDLETPASPYQSSASSLAGAPKDVSYPPRFEVRIISQDKTIRWKHQKVFVRNLLKREYICLDEIGDGL